jgi:hypothetical protein
MPYRPLIAIVVGRAASRDMARLLRYPIQCWGELRPACAGRSADNLGAVRRLYHQPETFGLRQGSLPWVSALAAGACCVTFMAPFDA